VPLLNSQALATGRLAHSKFPLCQRQRADWHTASSHYASGNGQTGTQQVPVMPAGNGQTGTHQVHVMPAGKGKPST